MLHNFETTGTLTKKVFKTLTPENERLHGLGTQLVEMEKDFDEMKRVREEAKKQLERKFEEVYR